MIRPTYVCNSLYFILLLHAQYVYVAVKANNDLPTMKILASLGCGFDCASRGEIEKVLSLGVSPLDIIYAHPCKDPEDIRYIFLSLTKHILCVCNFKLLHCSTQC